MTLSVSMLAIGIGAATAVSMVNLSIVPPVQPPPQPFPAQARERVGVGNASPQLPHIRQPSGHRGSGGHRRRYQMRAAARALATLEIAVRRAGAALAAGQL